MSYPVFLNVMTSSSWQWPRHKTLFHLFFLLYSPLGFEICWFQPVHGSFSSILTFYLDEALATRLLQQIAKQYNQQCETDCGHRCILIGQQDIFQQFHFSAFGQDSCTLPLVAGHSSVFNIVLFLAWLIKALSLIPSHSMHCCPIKLPKATRLTLCLGILASMEAIP